MIAFACEKVAVVPLQLTAAAASLLEQDTMSNKAIATIDEMKIPTLILIFFSGMVIQLILR
jgi:hypothetical protein